MTDIFICNEIDLEKFWFDHCCREENKCDLLNCLFHSFIRSSYVAMCHSGRSGLGNGDVDGDVYNTLLLMVTL